MAANLLFYIKKLASDRKFIDANYFFLKGRQDCGHMQNLFSFKLMSHLPASGSMVCPCPCPACMEIKFPVYAGNTDNVVAGTSPKVYAQQCILTRQVATARSVVCRCLRVLAAP